MFLNKSFFLWCLFFVLTMFVYDLYTQTSLYQKYNAKRIVVSGLSFLGVDVVGPNQHLDDRQKGLNNHSQKWSEYLAGLNNKYLSESMPLPEMVSIQSGVLYRGCLNDDEICKLTDVPIEIHQFKMAKSETTVELWDLCVARGGCDHFPDYYGLARGSNPVVNVSWDDVRQFIRWLNTETKRQYRLPTSDEWEYAVKANSKVSSPWWDTMPNCSQVRHGSPQWRKKSDRRCPDHIGPWDSLSGPANAWGLLNVVGNVSEWVEDCIDSEQVGRTSEAGKDCQNSRYNRGSNWNTPVVTDMIRSRLYERSHRYNRVGFRLAMSE